MKFFPRQTKLFFPIFREEEQEESETSDDGEESQESSGQADEGESSEGASATETDFDDSNELGIGEDEPAKYEWDESGDLEIGEEDEEGNGIHLEQDDDSKIGVVEFVDDEDSKWQTEEEKKKAQEEWEEFLREAQGIILIPPIVREHSTGCVHLEFDTPVDLRAAQPHSKNYEKYFDIKNKKSRGTSWYGGGCRNGKEVEELCKNGWPEGVERILEIQREINLEELYAKKSTRKKIRAKQGGVFHIHSARSGKLSKAWTRSVRVEAKKRLRKVEIWIQLIGAYWESSEDMFWAPATGLALSNFLQQRRIAVEIMACAFQDHMFSERKEKGKSLLTYTTLKPFTNHASVEEMATTALTGNLRHYWFMAMCSVAKTVTNSLGLVATVNDSVLPKVAPGAKRIIVPKLRSLGQAKKWLNHEIKEIMAKVELDD